MSEQYVQTQEAIRARLANIKASYEATLATREMAAPPAAELIWVLTGEELQGEAYLDGEFHVHGPGDLGDTKEPSIAIDGYDAVNQQALEDSVAPLQALLEALPETTERGFRYVKIPYQDYPSEPMRELTVQESSLATEHRLWVGPGEGKYRMHLSEDVARKLRDTLTAWLEA